MKQCLMVDVAGHQLNDAEYTILSHPLVAAVILFAKNFSSREQLIALIASIRSINSELMIAVDQEGGCVQRFQRHGFRSLPALRVFGELYDLNPELACQMTKTYAQIMASDLIDCGVNLCLAPVIDLHGSSPVIGGLDRAFHRDPTAVAILAEAYIDGMREKGMPSVVKHFPGHGCCDSDSHLTKPIHQASLAELKQRDLQPFQQLIQRGKVDIVMTAHVLYPEVDPQFTAGFSPIWLQDILRQQLGFTGIILSDCIGMAGADIGDLYARAKQAFAAGCNTVIVANQPRDELLKLLLQLESQRDELASPALAASNHAVLNRTVSV